MSTDQVDGEAVLELLFDQLDLQAKGNEGLQAYQDRHNLERRAISKFFGRHGRNLVQNYYAYQYAEWFPLQEVARLTVKIAEEGPKAEEERVWNYKDLQARCAQLNGYTNQYTVASDEYDWAEDAIASYVLAIQTLRERYLEDRLPGESAKEWLECVL